jgi:Ca2+-binding EF-hand superfamily protein
MDDDNSRSVDFYEFSKAVRDYRISIPENELQQIFGAIDKDGSGTIDYEEFLSVLRGPMNEFRRNLVL